MKYTNEITLALPLDKVIELFDSRENMKHWQRGLVSAEEIEGEPGQPGAKMRLVYKMGKREIEMVETITERELPRTFAATYEADNVWNLVANRFTAVSDNETKWVSDCEFRFSGFFMKTMGMLMPGAFRKQSQKYMDDFKNFAESGKSVADEG